MILFTHARASARNWRWGTRYWCNCTCQRGLNSCKRGSDWVCVWLYLGYDCWDQSDSSSFLLFE
jgi:hypothetical protein